MRTKPAAISVPTDGGGWTRDSGRMGKSKRSTSYTEITHNPLLSSVALGIF
jgi:hypothetical protein